MEVTNQDNLLGWLEELQSCLSKKEVKDFCQETYLKIVDLTQRYANHIVRIGVIGVTSSGKSSLLNAVLGRQLLPTGVPPSSGRQVICAYNRHTYAEVLFLDDSGQANRKLAANIPKVLAHYGDERENHNNCFKVKEIHCFSSAYRLPHNYILVDTPGLAAFGHEDHEEITMRLVVPTVDAIIYLTSAKCESDARTLRYIDSVTAQDKPLVVVQNKIDTVEEKLTRDLTMTKSRGEVQAEHLQRIRAMLQKAQKASVRTAPVIQVSARSGLGIPELIDAIQKQVDFNVESRKWRFAQQLLGYLTEQQETITTFLAKGKEKAQKLFGLQSRYDEECKIHKDFCDRYSKLCRMITEKTEVAKQCAANVVYSVCDGYNVPVPAAMQGSQRGNIIRFSPSLRELPDPLKNAKEELENRLKEITSTFNQAIQEIQTLLKDMAKKLNLQEQQLLRPLALAPKPIASISNAIEFETVRHPSYRVKQGGLWGLTKRVFTFGKCGYDDFPAYEETVSRFSPHEFIQSVVSSTDATIDFMNNSFPKFEGNTKYASDVIEKQLSEHKKTLQELSTSSNSIPADKLEMLLHELTEIGGKVRIAFGNEMPINNLAQPDIPIGHSVLQQHVCSELIYRMFEFAHSESFRLNSAWISGLVAKAESPTPKLQVFGWNELELEKFRAHFFPFDEYHSAVTFSNLANPQNMPSKSSLPSLIFVLLELGESGYSEKQFVDTGVRDYLRGCFKIPIVWCMCSASGLHGSLVEAFIELIRISKTVLGNKEPFDFMASDRNLYFSALLHELYFNTVNCVSENDRRKFVLDFGKVFHLSPAELNATGQHLNEYLMARNLKSK